MTKSSLSLKTMSRVGYVIQRPFIVPSQCPTFSCSAPAWVLATLSLPARSTRLSCNIEVTHTWLTSVITIGWVEKKHCFFLYKVRLTDMHTTVHLRSDNNTIMNRFCQFFFGEGMIYGLVSKGDTNIIVSLTGNTLSKHLTNA